MHTHVQKTHAYIVLSLFRILQNTKHQTLFTNNLKIFTWTLLRHFWPKTETNVQLQNVTVLYKNQWDNDIRAPWRLQYKCVILWQYDAAHCMIARSDTRPPNLIFTWTDDDELSKQSISSFMFRPPDLYSLCGQWITLGKPINQIQTSSFQQLSRTAYTCSVLM